MTQQLPRRKLNPVYYERLGYLSHLLQAGRASGFDRGLCIDRYYIEQFLSAHTRDIRGRVLEIGDDTYTRRFGGKRVIKSDVLNKTEDNTEATIVADLAYAGNVPQDSFDCIILTQTLQYIYDLKATIQTIYRILKPDGVVLATLPGIAYISRYDLEHWGEYWRLTSLSAKRLFDEVFPHENIEVQTHGNMLATLAFLSGIPADGFTQEELDNNHPDFQLVITVRAVKSNEFMKPL